MIEVEVLGRELAPAGPSAGEIGRLCALAAAAGAGIEEGHMAVQYVDAARIALLNREHRGGKGPTDVLSFPIDGAAPGVGDVPRELGDVIICPEHTSDLREAIVHGALHLVGMDHERDDGEMLALQARLLEEARA